MGGAQYKEVEFGEGPEISGNKFIAKEVIYWGWKSVEASLRQFKTTAQAADLTHQPGHIGLIHTKQQEPSPAKILHPILTWSSYKTWTIMNLFDHSMSE